MHHGKNYGLEHSMKVFIYCQHVLGVGHLYRTLEIAGAMQEFDVILVVGGGLPDISLPRRIRIVSLPGLRMDNQFKGLIPEDSGQTVDSIKDQRKNKLLALIKNEKPDLFFVELYPFGRKAFAFELVPVLEYIHSQPVRTCRVVCSLRDILVEKPENHLHETRVIKALNLWFDGVFIHSDPRLIKLDETFQRINDIQIPLIYTGFVAPKPKEEKVKEIQNQIRDLSKAGLIVASAGGGNVGARLLKAAVRAFGLMPENKNYLLKVFTGPYMKKEDKAELHSFSGPNIHVQEFCDDFVSLLAAADLSISMAGYNTCMNIVAAKVPSLVWPFSRNREQRSRVEKLNACTSMDLLEDRDLAPENLACFITRRLGTRIETSGDKLNMDGARNTVDMIGKLNL